MREIGCCAGGAMTLFFRACGRMNGRRGRAHVKKKKARNDVCGAAPPSPELPKTGATPAVAVPQKKTNFQCNIFPTYASNL